MARDRDQLPDLRRSPGGGAKSGDPGPFAVPEHIARLSPYLPGKPALQLERELGITGAIKMASNENPLGPSPRALEAARRAAGEMHLYPDGASFALRRGLAAHHGVDMDELVVGGGSNELIHLLVRTFCAPGRDEVVTHRHAFISYALAARTHGVDVVETPVTRELRCDVDALCAGFGPRTRLVFVANPNNPTGSHLTRAELEEVLERAPARALVVVDEAYHEYAAGLDPDYPAIEPYRAERPAVVALRTFSKIHGMAGLRIGYAICDRRAARRLDQTRRPFNVTSVAQVAALAALDDREHVARSLEAAASGVAALTRGFSGLGLTVLPSLANFVLVDVGREADGVYQGLLERGVITRPMAAWGLPRHLRVSIASAPDIARAVDAMAAVLAG
ncbi:MAG TPA: histidinol-phosphate transaminase [Kofleriaceae bacterium]|nr:histidinol-phosphate transaminase [Kofleriaceae bacterium]